MKVHRTVKVSRMIYSIYATEYDIFCYMSDNKINVYNYRLDNFQVLGQSDSPRLPYHFNPNYSGQIIQIAYRREMFFCLYDYKFDIINEMDGKVSRSLATNAIKFAIDNKGDILFLLKCGKRIFKYKMEFDFFEGPMNFSQRAIGFCITDENNIVFNYDYQDFLNEIDFSNFFKFFLFYLQINFVNLIVF